MGLLKLVSAHRRHAPNPRTVTFTQLTKIPIADESHQLRHIVCGPRTRQCKGVRRGVGGKQQRRGFAFVVVPSFVLDPMADGRDDMDLGRDDMDLTGESVRRAATLRCG